MTERQKVIIDLFHQSHSLFRTCREDLSIMIEQHGRNALLADRMVESARRMETAMDSLPHMCDLIEAVDEAPDVGQPVGEEETVTAPEPGEVPEPETETEPEPGEVPVRSPGPGDVPDAPSDPTGDEMPVDD